jgi:hypothetical protein
VGSGCESVKGVVHLDKKVVIRMVSKETFGADPRASRFLDLRSKAGVQTSEVKRARWLDA